MQRSLLPPPPHSHALSKYTISLIPLFNTNYRPYQSWATQNNWTFLHKIPSFLVRSHDSHRWQSYACMVVPLEIIGSKGNLQELMNLICLLHEWRYLLLGRHLLLGFCSCCGYRRWPRYELSSFLTLWLTFTFYKKSSYNISDLCLFIETRG